MPRLSDHPVKSLIRLVRQSTTVPNTSNTSAFTAETSDMIAPCFFPVVQRRLHRALPGPPPTPRQWSIEVELVKLPMLGLDGAHRAGDRAHHHGLGFDNVILAEFDAGQKRPCG